MKLVFLITGHSSISRKLNFICQDVKNDLVAIPESALLVFFLLLPVLLLPTSVADEEGLLAALVVPDLRSFAPEELLLSPLKGIKEKKLMSQLLQYPSVPSSSRASLKYKS